MIVSQLISLWTFAWQNTPFLQSYRFRLTASNDYIIIMTFFDLLKTFTLPILVMISSSDQTDRVRSQCVIGKALFNAQATNYTYLKFLISFS